MWPDQWPCCFCWIIEINSYSTPLKNLNTISISFPRKVNFGIIFAKNVSLYARVHCFNTMEPASMLDCHNDCHEQVPIPHYTTGFLSNNSLQYRCFERIFYSKCILSRYRMFPHSRIDILKPLAWTATVHTRHFMHVICLVFGNFGPWHFNTYKHS